MLCLEGLDAAYIFKEPGKNYMDFEKDNFSMNRSTVACTVPLC